MNDSNIAILTDLAGNPVTASPTANLATGQSSVLLSGSDYGATAKAQVQHVDSFGQGYAVPVSTTGVALPVGINASGSATGGFGNVPVGWDATTGSGYWRPLNLDATGSLVIRSSQYPTANWSPGALVSTTTTSGRSMLSFYNASGASYSHRILAIYAVCPPQVNTTGGLLGIGSGTSYTPIFFEVHRFSTLHSGGATVAPGIFDPTDAYDTSLTCRYGATISGELTPVLCQWDAAYNGSVPVAKREDTLSKEIVIAPGSGVHIKCITTLSTSIAFQMRVMTLQSAY